MEATDYSFLNNRLLRVVDKIPLGDDPGTPLSTFIIQLRKPEYWIVLTARSSNSQTSLLFDGNWTDAIDHFSTRPENFPDISRPAKSLETPNLFELVRDSLKSTIVHFAKAIISGDRSVSIFTNGVFVFKNPGILKESEDLYLDRFFSEQQQKGEPSPGPFAEDVRDRRAFFCRFPILSQSGDGHGEVRAELLKALGSETDLLHEGWQPIRRFSYLGVKMLLSANGLLLADERHQVKALDALNAFLGYSFFRGAGCAPASLQDIGSLVINPDGTMKSSIPAQSSTRRIPLVQTSISITEIDSLLSGFKDDLDGELLTELKLLHWAFFHLAAGEFLQSFTLAWIVIERRIARQWRELLLGKGYSGERLQQLCESDRYTMSVKIDMLEVAFEIGKEQAARLHTIRQSRNKASHEGRIPTRQQTEECLNLAGDLIKLSWPVLIDIRELTSEATTEPDPN